MVGGEGGVDALKLALARVSRVFSLYIDIDYLPDCEWDAIDDLLGNSYAPTLHFLKIVGKERDGTQLKNLFQNDRPSLRSLELRYLTVSPAISFAKFSSLTFLHLFFVTVKQWRTLQDVLDTICSSPDIEELEIRDSISHGMQDAPVVVEAPSRQRVHLPNMKRFRLEDQVHVVRYIVSCISIPRTSKLRLICQDVLPELAPRVCDMVNSYFKDTRSGRPLRVVHVDPSVEDEPLGATILVGGGDLIRQPGGARDIQGVFSLDIRFAVQPGQLYSAIALFSPLLRGLSPIVRDTPALSVKHRAFDTSAMWRECFFTFRQVEDLRAIGSVAVGLSQALKSPPEVFPKLKALHLQETDLENTPPVGRALNSGEDFSTRGLLREAAKARKARRIPFKFNEVLPGTFKGVPVKI